jgi:hypothetical protein
MMGAQGSTRGGGRLRLLDHEPYAGERPMGIGSHLSAWNFAFTSPRNDLFSHTNSDAASAKG